VSSAGDLGYTTGSYEVTVNDAEGNPVTSRGKVVVVWKKQPDGNWKAVLDIWNSDGPAASE
jgi:ketosteroid isomerase-like protein